MKARIISIVTGWIVAACVGCGVEEQAATKPETPVKPAPTPTKKAEIGKNVFLETEGEQRRVLIEAEVCLRQGQLEQFLTRRRTKEHEAILVADIDARHVHTALTLAKAEAGSPVRFLPKYTPAHGTAIKVLVEFEDAQKQKHRIPAQQWIRNAKTKKDLEQNWVFAGSVFVEDPFDKTKPPFYTANDGTVICVSNFESALLDLPIESSQANEALFFEANTERIPKEGSRVLVILEPVPAKLKTKDKK